LPGQIAASPFSVSLFSEVWTMKRVISVAVLLVLFVSCASAALPLPIYPLDYDSLPEPSAGVHHYLMACFDTWDFKSTNLGNTDGILLVTMDTEQDRLIFTTVMREILVQRPDGKSGRITYIAKNYGADALCRVISTHFGIKVEKYLLFNWDNIQTLIDELGGVHITVTDAEAAYLNRYRIARDSTTPSMDKAGTYLFTGHAAMIYMRIRKVGGDGDIGRTRRIRTVMETLVEENRDMTMSKAMDVAAALTDNICLTNLSMNELMLAISYAFHLRNADVVPEGFQLPVTEALTPISYAGMATNQVDFALCREKFLQFLAAKPQ
jgi:polyisoprenyl-teichoic acid--peptidoglycan teichoic acid transferase